MEYTISLAGNPNVGKTSLYNRITHSLEHVGNWHGVTVAEVSKKTIYCGHTVNMIDLPGLYSLSVYSPEEGISRDRILENKSDLVVNICEVNNLSRNLYLTLQLLELGVPIVVAVNMMDELHKRGQALDCEKLEKALGVPVVAMSAKYRNDVASLMNVCLNKISAGDSKPIELEYLKKLPLAEVISVIGENARAAGFKPEWAAIKALENDGFVLDKLALDEKQIAALKAFGDMQARVAQVRYEFIDGICEGLIYPIKSATKKKNKSAKSASGLSGIDRIVLNKYFALPIFFAVMALIFIITFGLVGNFFTWLLELGIDKLLYNPITNGLGKIDCPRWIIGLLGDGIIHGVGGVLVFLPQIVLLFFFLALLEDSGYISRVAFMTDGIFRKIGLSGRSAFTMLMGFGCSATAVLTARGLEDDMMRKKTILLTPFMSCSARLPVYATIASAFFASGKPFIIFGMYILGACVSLSLAAIFEKCIKPLKSGRLSFIMEMPPYRFPTAERVFQIIWNNVKVFLIRVGTTIFALNVIVWVLSNFSFTAGYTVGKDAKSILQIISGWIAPVFKPFGFGNWKAVTSLLSGLVAKEVVISSMESLGGVDAIFTGSHASLSALTFMVFTLLYVPCIATLGAIRKEIGIKWMLFSLALQIGIAYAVSLIFYGIGLLYYIHKGIFIGGIIVLAVAVICFAAIMHGIKNGHKCEYCSGNCVNCTKTSDKKKRK